MKFLKTKRARIFFAVLFVAKLSLLALTLISVLHGNDAYAVCQDCFCIPDTGEPCPTDRLSTVAKNSTDLVPKLRSILYDNPYNFTCDPYLDAGCEGSDRARPEANVTDTAVFTCVVDYTFESIDSCPTSYRLRTYPGSVEDAHRDGLAVTHSGPCGACSSLQDLAAYMEQGPSLRSSSATCGIRGRLWGKADGLSCFLELGFTESCARIWYYNTCNTARHCLRQCAQFVLTHESPNDATKPGCPLSPCIECDEAYSGPLFTKFAGRTRRNSGLRSNIARRCSEMTVLEPHDPCDQVTSLSAVLVEGNPPSTAQYEKLAQYMDEVKLPHASVPDTADLLWPAQNRRELGR
jgi:hypothetical protein